MKTLSRSFEPSSPEAGRQKLRFFSWKAVSRQLSALKLFQILPLHLSKITNASRHEPAGKNLIFTRSSTERRNASFVSGGVSGCVSNRESRTPQKEASPAPYHLLRALAAQERRCRADTTLRVGRWWR
jgi:hypothetical protein